MDEWPVPKLLQLIALILACDDWGQVRFVLGCLERRDISIDDAVETLRVSGTRH